MRKTALMSAVCFVLIKAQAQQPAANPFPKTITVSGSAEMEIIPDQIFVNITLQEYQKKGENRKNIESIKTEFLNACTSAGIADSMISIDSYEGFNNYYLLRRRKIIPELSTSITYQIKFSNSKQMDNLIEKLDDAATVSFDIARTSHSRITDYRRQLKIQAVKAAKEKALYLAEAIGEKVGAAVTINEPQEPGTYTLLNTSNGFFSNAVADSVRFNRIEVDFKKIKLRYEVNVVFALQ